MKALYDELLLSISTMGLILEIKRLPYGNGHE
jgi:hypothetical protein